MNLKLCNMLNGILVFKVPVNRRSDSSIQAKIDEIDLIVNELFTTAMRSVTSGEVAEYELDTGQTRVKKKYNSPAIVRAEIENYEALRQMYVNMLNKATGSYRLMNERNFKRR
jgi:hypothetical protein